MQTACVVLFFLVVVVYATELITDPGLLSLRGNQCAETNVWHFRSDYVWNHTESYVNSRCAAYLELPTEAQPGITKGNITNINRAKIPAIPTNTGTFADATWPSSAAVVDMNSPCRAALWAPFRIPAANPTSLRVQLKLWVRSNDQLVQFLRDDSLAHDAQLLQYLPLPYGLLGENLEIFPPEVDRTNQIRIDVIRPDAQGSFYDRAFTLIASHIAATIPIPNFVDGTVVPENGTSEQWIQVSADIASQLHEQGLFALRIAGAQSEIGVSWGVSDVHIDVQPGLKRRETEGLYEVEDVAEEVLGTMSHVLPTRMTSY